MANFPATARIPCRPLSYANKDLVEPKELVVDYEKGDLYLSKEDGEVISVANTVKEIIMEKIQEDPEIADITLTLPDGSEQKISVTVLENVKNIAALQESLGYVEDDLGNISFKILDQITNVDDQGNVQLNVSAGDVTETDEKQFISKKEKEQLSNIIENVLNTDEEGNMNVSVSATNITETDDKQFITKKEREKIAKSEFHTIITATVVGDGTDGWTKNSDGYYTKTIAVDDILESDNPIVDIDLSGVTYSDAMDQLDSYAYIQRITTQDGSITVYASDPVVTDFKIRLKCDRTE